MINTAIIIKKINIKTNKQVRQNSSIQFHVLTATWVPKLYRQWSGRVVLVCLSVLSGSLLSGFTNGHKKLTLISGGRYYRNFTALNLWRRCRSPVQTGSGGKLYHASSKFKELRWFLHGLAPEYLSSKFERRETAYNLRDSENKLNVPLPRTNYYKTRDPK